MSDPTPPTDVRAVMHDGQQIPLECRYAGQVDGVDQWETVLDLPTAPRYVTVGAMPPRSSIVVAWSE